jgi:chromosome segregation ATPase
MTTKSRSQGSESSDHTISGRSRGADAPAIHTKMTNKKFEDAVQEFAKDLGAKRVEYMGFETKIVYALAIDEIDSLRSQLADARQKNIRLNEMLGKAQSRDSSTTNKKLRKEIEKLKWEMENMQGTLTFERPDDKRIFEMQVENQKLTAENKKLTQRIADLEAEAGGYLLTDNGEKVSSSGLSPPFFF